MNPDETVEPSLVDKMPVQHRGEIFQHIFGAAAFSALPWIGGSIAAIYSGTYAASEQARLDAWLRELAEAVVELQGSRSISKDEIFSDGRFHAAVAQGIRIVAETNREEMRTAIAHAVSNSGSWSGNQEVVDRFLMNLLSRYELEHLLVLQLFDNPKEFHRVHGHKLGEPTLMWIFTRVIYKDVVEWEPLATAVLRDLGNDGLIEKGFGFGSELSSTDGRRTTYMGHALLDFVNKSPSPAD